MSDVLTPFLPSAYDPDEEWKDCNKIDSQEFQLRLNEPLWAMTDALFYLHGYKTNLHESEKFRLLRFKPTVEKMRVYILDAQKTNELTLYDYHVEPITDPNTDDFQKQRDTPFYGSKVRPKEFVEWVKNLPVKLSMLNAEEKENPKPLSDRERISLLKMVIGMAVKGYGYNPQSSRSTTAKEIASDLQLLGVSVDEDTVRKWLRESALQLPSDWNSSP